MKKEKRREKSCLFHPLSTQVVLRQTSNRRRFRKVVQWLSLVCLLGSVFPFSLTATEPVSAEGNPWRDSFASGQFFAINDWTFSLPVFDSKGQRTLNSLRPGEKYPICALSGTRAYLTKDRSFYVPAMYVTPYLGKTKKQIRQFGLKDFAQTKFYKKKYPRADEVRGEEDLVECPEIKAPPGTLLAIRGGAGEFFATDFFGNRGEMLFVRGTELDYNGQYFADQEVQTEPTRTVFSRMKGVNHWQFSLPLSQDVPRISSTGEVVVYTQSIAQEIVPNQTYTVSRIADGKAYIDEKYGIWFPAKWFTRLNADGEMYRLWTRAGSIPYYRLASEATNESSLVEVGRVDGPYEFCSRGLILRTDGDGNWVSTDALGDTSATIFFRQADLESVQDTRERLIREAQARMEQTLEHQQLDAHSTSLRNERWLQELAKEVPMNRSKRSKRRRGKPILDSATLSRLRERLCFLMIALSDGARVVECESALRLPNGQVLSLSPAELRVCLQWIQQAQGGRTFSAQKQGVSSSESFRLQTEGLTPLFQREDPNLEVPAPVQKVWRSSSESSDSEEAGSSEVGRKLEDEGEFEPDELDEETPQEIADSPLLPEAQAATPSEVPEEGSGERPSQSELRTKSVPSRKRVKPQLPRSLSQPEELRERASAEPSNKPPLPQPRGRSVPSQQAKKQKTLRRSQSVPGSESPTSSEGDEDSDDEEAQPQEDLPLTPDDLEELDERFQVYTPFIRAIFAACEIEEYPKTPYVDAKENALPRAKWTTAILEKLCYICNRIYQSPKITQERGAHWQPHAVQLLATLKLVESALTGTDQVKGTIADIKTGEGKSFVVALTAMTLVLFGRKVDIVTPTMELATRDWDEQKLYYDTLGLSSGFLYNKLSDKGFAEAVGVCAARESECPFNLEVLANDIVYSMNSTFEWLYLNQHFSNHTFRGKRPFDVVIVDEADNILLDQAKSPAILSQSLPISDQEAIFKESYALANAGKGVEEMVATLSAHFPKAKFSMETVEQLRKAAISAFQKERDKDYIIQLENVDSGEMRYAKHQIQIMDENTGYRKPASRWGAYLHEMIEVKEELPIQRSSVYKCGIAQMVYFNFFRTILGMTGTTGGETEKDLFYKNYHVLTFAIPTNKRTKRQVCVQWVDTDEELEARVVQEARAEAAKGRPVLVMTRYVRDSNAFRDKYFPGCPVIQGGIDEKADKQAIRQAGKSGRITVSTSAAGRGTNIKPTKRSVRAGGLHVIIVNPPKCERDLEQNVGRSARQGQPGTATVYRKMNHEFLELAAPSAHPLYLHEMMTVFLDETISRWPWLIAAPKEYTNDAVYSFGAEVPELLFLNAENITTKFYWPGKCLNRDEMIELTNLALEMVIVSWGKVYTAANENEERFKQPGECLNVLKELNQQLFEYVPEDCAEAKDLLNHLVKKLGKDEEIYHLLYDMAESETILDVIDRVFRDRRFQLYVLTSGGDLRSFQSKLSFLPVEHQEMYAEYLAYLEEQRRIAEEEAAYQAAMATYHQELAAYEAEQAAEEAGGADASGAERPSAGASAPRKIPTQVVCSWCGKNPKTCSCKSLGKHQLRVPGNEQSMTYNYSLDFRNQTQAQKYAVRQKIVVCPNGQSRTETYIGQQRTCGFCFSAQGTCSSDAEFWKQPPPPPRKEAPPEEPTGGPNYRRMGQAAFQLMCSAAQFGSGNLVGVVLGFWDGLQDLYYGYKGYDDDQKGSFGSRDLIHKLIRDFGIESDRAHQVVDVLFTLQEMGNVVKLAKHIPKLLKGGKRAIDLFKKQSKKGVGKTRDKLKQGLDKTKDKLKQGLDKTKDKLKNKSQDVAQKVRDGVPDGKKAIQGISRRTVDQVRQVTRQTIGVAQRVVRQGVDTACNVQRAFQSRLSGGGQPQFAFAGSGRPSLPRGTAGESRSIQFMREPSGTKFAPKNSGGGAGSGVKPTKAGETPVKRPPNPHGKKGGEAHRDKIEEVEEYYKERGFRKVRDDGKEHKFETPGGHKSSRYTDSYLQHPETGEEVFVQVGRANKKPHPETGGIVPISRERKAIEDIKRSRQFIENHPDARIEFHRYLPRPRGGE